MASTSKARTTVFISYSHHNKRYLDELVLHLEPLRRESDVEIWADTKIRAGDDWQREIREALASAKVALVLVSAPFRASEFITRNELPLLLASAKTDGLVIIPVVVGACDFDDSELAGTQAINTPSKPLDSLRPSDRNKVWVQVVRRVKEVLTDRNATLEQVPNTSAVTSDSSVTKESTDPVSEARRANEEGRYYDTAQLVRPLAEANASNFPAWFEYAYALAKTGNERTMGAFLHAWDYHFTHSPDMRLERLIPANTPCAFVAASGLLSPDMTLPLTQGTSLLLTEHGSGERIRRLDDRLPALKSGSVHVAQKQALRLLARAVDSLDRRWILLVIYGSMNEHR